MKNNASLNLYYRSFKKFINNNQLNLKLMKNSNYFDGFARQLKR